MNKSFQPTATDIASYVQVIDRNKNGKVSVEELENFIIRYFLNPNRNWSASTIPYLKIFKSKLEEKLIRSNVLKNASNLTIQLKVLPIQTYPWKRFKTVKLITVLIFLLKQFFTFNLQTIFLIYSINFIYICLQHDFLFLYLIFIPLSNRSPILTFNSSYKVVNF